MGKQGKTHAEVNTGGRWMDSAKLRTPIWSFMDHHQCVHLKTLGMETTKGKGRERKKTAEGEGKGGSGTNQQPRSKGRGGRRDELQLSRTRWKKGGRGEILLKTGTGAPGHRDSSSRSEEEEWCTCSSLPWRVALKFSLLFILSWGDSLPLNTN